MNRAAAIVCVLAVVAAGACGGTSKTTETARSATTSADAGAADAAASDATPEPVEPWPQTKPGAAWLVVDWTMTDREASEALEGAGFQPHARKDPTTGRVEAVDVASTLIGWRASITIDAATNKVGTIIVRGDPASIAQAHAERAKLEERFGAPIETHVHWSKQCANDRAIEIEGPFPAWRVTQSLARQGEAKTAVDWPSLKDLTWGMPASAVGKAMKSAGFVVEKVPPPPKPSKGAKQPKPRKPPKRPPPPPKEKGGKLIEVTFKKDDQHVRLGIFEKTGLQTVAVGRDVADRKAAEHRANDALGDLGSCLSEAETETSLFRDAAAEMKLSITGFQGQRVVFESYRNPAAPSKGD